MGNMKTTVGSAEDHDCVHHLGRFEVRLTLSTKAKWRCGGWEEEGGSSCQDYKNSSQMRQWLNGSRGQEVRYVDVSFETSCNGVGHGEVCGFICPF